MPKHTKKDDITPVATITPAVNTTTTTTTTGITTQAAGSKTVLAYMVNNAPLTLDVVDEICVATYVTDELGNLSGYALLTAVSTAKANGKKVTMMVGNNFDSSIAKTLLSSSANRTHLINNILSAIKANGYNGVNIDIENVPAGERANYTALISEASAKLKPLGYMVTVAVPAKTSDDPNATWNYAFDYKAIAQYVDYVMIMTYDEHYPGGTPGAVASIGWVTNVANYAVTVIPKNKILIGLAAYGYDWVGTVTNAYSIDGCMNIASRYGASIIWDSASQTPHFNYTDGSGSHQVWFENSYSIPFKIKLVNSLGLAGIGIWRLGLENAAYMAAIRNNLA